MADISWLMSISRQASENGPIMPPSTGLSTMRSVASRAALRYSQVRPAPTAGILQRLDALRVGDHGRDDRGRLGVGQLDLATERLGLHREVHGGERRDGGVLARQGDDAVGLHLAVE